MWRQCFSKVSTRAEEGKDMLLDPWCGPGNQSALKGELSWKQVLLYLCVHFTLNQVDFLNAGQEFYLATLCIYSHIVPQQLLPIPPASSLKSTTLGCREITPRQQVSFPEKVLLEKEGQMLVMGMRGGHQMLGMALKGQGGFPLDFFLSLVPVPQDLG